jgi:type II secretory pathway pseudopilin PulG
MSATDDNRGPSPASPERGRLENRGFFRRPPARQSGFTFLGLMIIVMIIGAGLAATGPLFSHEAQREKERELLFVGNQFRDAIESYYRHSPGAASYPKTLDELVEDKRFPMPVHHLRRVYADPFTGKPDWVLVKTPDGTAIMGVHSSSEEAPVKTGNFDARDAAFEDKEHYTEWEFAYVPQGLAPKSPTGAPQSPAGAPPSPAGTPQSPAPKG